MAGEGAHSRVRDRTCGISGEAGNKTGCSPNQGGWSWGRLAFKVFDVTGVKGQGQEGLGSEAGPSW